MLNFLILNALINNIVCFEINIDFFYLYFFKDTLKLKSFFGN